MKQLFLLAVCIGLISCQEATTEDMTAPRVETATAEPEKKEVVPEEEVFAGPTCKELEIPSWQRTIGQLTENRCVRCHNADFAWNDVQLQTYDLFVVTADESRRRLEEGDLTIEITQLDVLTYLAWFDAGMPETEEDCVPE